MGLQEIIQRLSVYALPAIGMIIALVIILFVVNRLINKRRPEGARRSVRVPIIAALLIGYFFVVLGLTGLSRGGNFSGSVNLNLLSGYLEAWNSYSLISFQLIVFNMIMFIPLGILLPLLSSKFYHFRWTLLASFGASLLIELIQLITGRGIFELDDLLHNTLGGLIGYHLYMLVDSVRKNKKVFLKDGKYLTIPIVFLLLFGAVQIVYHTKEFGNLDIRPSIGTDMTGIKISTTIELDTEPGSMPVYKNKAANSVENGREVVRLLQDQLGLSEVELEGRDGDNRQFEFRANEYGKYRMTYFVRDATWTLVNDDYQSDVEPVNKEELRAQAEAILSKLNLLPEGAVPVTAQVESYHWKVEPTHYPQEDLTEGLVMITLTPEGIVNGLYNYMTHNEYVRDVQIISPEEAYERLVEGEFDSYNPFHEGDTIMIDEYEMDYVYDSKGFYQPVYRFKGELNSQDEWEKLIPAI